MYKELVSDGTLVVALNSAMGKCDSARQLIGPSNTEYDALL